MKKIFAVLLKILAGLVLLLFLAAVGLVAYVQLTTVRGEWHYKITVSVDTPEGMKTGSTVRTVYNDSMKHRLIDLPEMSNPAAVSGEAVVVDLGSRGILFGLIESDSCWELYESFQIEGPTTYDGIVALNAIPIGAKAPLADKRYWPKFVMFADMTDAKSVQPIDPDDMAQHFGNGVKIQGITVEMTDEPKTKTGILNIIPKFDESFWLWRRKLKPNDGRKVSGANFSTVGVR